MDGLMLLWTARQTGLTDDDLKTFSYEELDAWFELFEWTNVREGDDGEPVQSASATERAFFHLN